MEQPMGVSRCICHNVPFTTIAEMAKRGMTFAQIQTETKCSTGCAMCEPYVHVVIRTGRTIVPVLSQAQVDAVMRESRGDAKA